MVKNRKWLIITALVSLLIVLFAVYIFRDEFWIEQRTLQVTAKVVEKMNEDGKYFIIVTDVPKNKKFEISYNDWKNIKMDSYITYEIEKHKFVLIKANE